MSADAQTAPVIDAQEVVSVPFARFCGYFLWLGTTGFGGPIALAGYMQRDLVERRRRVRREDYLEGLALAQLAPGPLAASLAPFVIVYDNSGRPTASSASLDGTTPTPPRGGL